MLSQLRSCIAAEFNRTVRNESVDQSRMRLAEMNMTGNSGLMTDLIRDSTGGKDWKFPDQVQLPGLEENRSMVVELPQEGHNFTNLKPGKARQTIDRSDKTMRELLDL